MIVQREAFRLLYSDEAEACLELWWISRLDTYDIAKMLSVGEDAVVLTIQAARDMVIILAREAAL